MHKTSCAVQWYPIYIEKEKVHYSCSMDAIERRNAMSLMDYHEEAKEVADMTRSLNEAERYRQKEISPNEWCPECEEHKPDDARVQGGLRCGQCAYGR